MSLKTHEFVSWFLENKYKYSSSWSRKKEEKHRTQEAQISDAEEVQIARFSFLFSLLGFWGSPTELGWFCEYLKCVELHGFKLSCFSVDCAGGDVRRIWCVLYSVPRWLRIFPREAKKGESTRVLVVVSPPSLTRSVLSVHVRGLPSRVEYDVIVWCYFWNINFER